MKKLGKIIISSAQIMRPSLTPQRSSSFSFYLLFLLLPLFLFSCEKIAAYSVAKSDDSSYPQDNRLSDSSKPNDTTLDNGSNDLVSYPFDILDWSKTLTPSVPVELTSLKNANIYGDIYFWNSRDSIIARTSQQNTLKIFTRNPPTDEDFTFVGQILLSDNKGVYAGVISSDGYKLWVIGKNNNNITTIYRYDRLQKGSPFNPTDESTFYFENPTERTDLFNKLPVANTIRIYDLFLSYNQERLYYAPYFETDINQANMLQYVAFASMSPESDQFINPQAVENLTTNLLEIGYLFADPMFTADEKTIVFAAAEPSDTVHLYYATRLSTQDPFTNYARIFNDATGRKEHALSPDGKELIYKSEDKFYSVSFQ